MIPRVSNSRVLVFFFVSSFVVGFVFLSFFYNIIIIIIMADVIFNLWFLGFYTNICICVSTSESCTYSACIGALGALRKACLTRVQC